MKKVILALSVLVTVSVIFNIYQQTRWNKLYDKIATDYQYSLTSTITYLSEMENTDDARVLSLDAVRVWNAPNQLIEKGSYMHLMLKNPPNNVNGFYKVGTDLWFFTDEIWRKNGITAPTPGNDNRTPSKDDLNKLNRIYQIFRKHFTDTVIWSGDYQMQRDAILSATEELKQQGLDSVLPYKDKLDYGVF